MLHVHDIVDRVPWFWRRSDVVLAASQAVADRLGGLDPQVVFAPVDADPPPAESPWPTGNGPVIGFVGRIEPRKGPLDLVRAAPAIRRGAPGARLVVLGSDPYGSDPAYTEAVIASPEVEHHPWIDNAPGVMRHLDVLVLPSHREPFGTVLAEAMAVGTRSSRRASTGCPRWSATGSPAGSSRRVIRMRSQPRCSRSWRDARRWAEPPASTRGDSTPTTMRDAWRAC